MVNKCLFQYFSSVAEKLGCDAIWWDAISIPQKPEARSAALRVMHTNYSAAEATVVHDSYLTNFSWDDDGGPCLALVLSSWFTRGWTALELLSSRRVKVLFKNPQPGSDKDGPLIKDLDDDILAKSPATSSRGYWLATTIVKRLRQHARWHAQSAKRTKGQQEGIREVGDLLATLQGRSTSWLRDRTIIAALLSGVRIEKLADLEESEITRQMLQHEGHVPRAALLHGKPTMKSSEGFSWCTATLDDMPIDVAADVGGSDTARAGARVRVGELGGIEGCWWARPLRRDEAIGRGLVPKHDEGAASVEIASALRRWRACLLLRDAKKRSVLDPVLLVMTLGAYEDGTLQCRYAGAVLVSPRDAKENADGPWEHIWAVIGGVGDDRGWGLVDARDALSGQAGLEGNQKKNGEAQEPGDGSNDDHITLLDDDPFRSTPNPRKPLGSPGMTEEKKRTGSQTRRKRTGRRASSPDAQAKRKWTGKPASRTTDGLINRHLLDAVREGNREVIRYLTRLGAGLPPGPKQKIWQHGNSKATYDGVRMLGDVYLEDKKLTDAAELYEIAVDGFSRTSGPMSRATLEAKRALGNTYRRMGDERAEDTERTLRSVLEQCGTKRIGERLRTEISLAADREAKRASKAPRTDGDGSEIFSCRYHGIVIEEWDQLELRTLDNLARFYIDRGDKVKAAEMYRQALGKYGTPPLDIEAFGNNGLQTTCAAQSSSDDCKKRDDAMTLYRRAMQGFERAFGGDLEKHTLPLVTFLNLGINQILRGNGREKETQDFLERAYEGFLRQAEEGSQEQGRPDQWLREKAENLINLQQSGRPAGDAPPEPREVDAWGELSRFQIENTNLKEEIGRLQRANEQLRVKRWVCVWSEAIGGVNLRFSSQDGSLYYKGKRVVDINGHPVYGAETWAKGEIGRWDLPIGSSPGSDLGEGRPPPYAQHTLCTAVMWSCCRVSELPSGYGSIYTWIDLTFSGSGSSPMCYSGARSIVEQEY